MFLLGFKKKKSKQARKTRHFNTKAGQELSLSLSYIFNRSYTFDRFCLIVHIREHHND